MPFSSTSEYQARLYAQFAVVIVLLCRTKWNMKWVLELNDVVFGYLSTAPFNPPQLTLDPEDLQYHEVEHFYGIRTRRVLYSNSGYNEQTFTIRKEFDHIAAYLNSETIPNTEKGSFQVVRSYKVSPKTIESIAFILNDLFFMATKGVNELICISDRSKVCRRKQSVRTALHGDPMPE